jgi:hypothetical protein
MARPSGRPDSYHALPFTSPTSPNPTAGHRAPLLAFDSNGYFPTNSVDEKQDRISKSTSVFGVDQLWEKEMIKLKIIQERQERERVEKEANGKEEEAKMERKWLGKGRKKDKGKGKAVSSTYNIGLIQTENRIMSKNLDSVSTEQLVSDPPRMSSHLHIDGTSGTVPLLGIGDEDPNASSRLNVGGWFAGSDMEDDTEDKASHHEPDPEAQGNGEREVRDDRIVEASDTDEEDEVPLSKLAVGQSGSRLSDQVIRAVGEESSDAEEDLPLSKIVATRSAPNISKLSSSLTKIHAPLSTGSSNFPAPHDKANTGDDEEDDIPLGLRIPTSSSAKLDQVEDDLPLGYKHAGAATRQMASISIYGPLGLYPPTFSPYTGGQPFPSMPNISPWGMMNPYMQPFPQQAMMTGRMPYEGGMGGLGGWPSMPHLGVYGQPQMMGVGMGVGMGDMNKPGRNIDDWRQGVGGESQY